MAKEAFYFSHDYGARNDPKLQKVLMKLGQEGKGVFWDLIEMSFEEGGKLLICECESYAFALRTNIKIIISLIDDFELFEKDEVFFWSNSVINRLNLRHEKSEKARMSAKKRWDNANALPTQSECNAIKEIKGKEIKGNITTHTQDEFSHFNLLGKRDNVYLTDKHLNELDCLIGSRKKVLELVDELSDAIGIGKYPKWNCEVQDAHCILIEKFYKHQKKNKTGITLGKSTLDLSNIDFG